MKGKLIIALSALIAWSVGTNGRESSLAKFDSASPEACPDVFWLDRYGNISWEDEKARLDNFAIRLMNEPNLIGYFYVRAGKQSCRGEAQARAVRAKNYMVKVRHSDWSRIIWRDIGFGDGFEVSIWLAPRGNPPMYVPEYTRATKDHVIQRCGTNPLAAAMTLRAAKKPLSYAIHRKELFQRPHGSLSIKEGRIPR